MFGFLFIFLAFNVSFVNSGDIIDDNSFKAKFENFLNEENIKLTKEICEYVLESYELNENNYELSGEKWDASGDSTVNQSKIPEIDIKVQHDIVLNTKISSVINPLGFSNVTQEVLNNSDINVGNISVKQSDEILVLNFLKKFPKYKDQIFNYLKGFLEDGG